MKKEKKTKVYEQPDVACVAVELEHRIANSLLDSSRIDDFKEEDYNFSI